MAFVGKSDNITIRETCGMKIVFFDRRTIYVVYLGGVFIYDRWYVRKRGFYSRNWKPFRNALMYHSQLSIRYINYLADKFEINCSGGVGLPDFGNRKVVMASSRGRSRNSRCHPFNEQDR